MLLCKQHNNALLRSGILLATAVGGLQAWTPSLTFGDAPTENSLKITSIPTLVPVGTPANEVSLASPENRKSTAEAQSDKAPSGSSISRGVDKADTVQAQPNALEPKQRVLPKLLLISDGWNTRKSVNNLTPLLDPAQPKPSYVSGNNTVLSSPANQVGQPSLERQTKSPSAASGEATVAVEQPRRTLDFIMPETKPVAPKASLAVEPKRVPAEPTIRSKPTRLANDQYGPGMPARVSETKREAPQSCGDERELRSPAVVEDYKKPTQALVRPEQNEPASITPPSNEPQRIATSRVGDSLDDEPSLEELKSLDSDDSDSESEPMEIRSIKLKSDGSVEGEAKTPLQRFAPASNRNDARQSVGDQVDDEPLPLVPTSQSRDAISARGDLVLGIGLDESQIRISPTTAKLRVPIERTLNFYWNRPENTVERTHWGMFHQMMIFDKDTAILHQNRKYNAVAWMAGNNPCRNQIVFDQDKQGIIVKEGIGLQGHQAQMLAIFGLIDVPASYPLYVGKRKYTVEDVLRREMANCKSGNELTFTLIGVSHYIDTDTQWVANNGEDWNFERLIREELAQPIVGAACGGTHRLMGFAHALRRRRAEGKPITGQWERADRYVNDFIEYTWQLQNRDGSMSTEWFEKKQDNGNIDRKIQTTGHMVEFLLSALPPEKLQSPQMLRSMTFLVNTLYQERGHEWPVGPKGHALRSLTMYYRAVFGRTDPWRPISVASRSTSNLR